MTKLPNRCFFYSTQAPPQRVEVLVMFYALIVDRNLIGTILTSMRPFEQVAGWLQVPRWKNDDACTLAVRG